MQLEWKTTPLPTLFHAASGIVAGRSSTQADLLDAIHDDLEKTSSILSARGISPAVFCSHLIVHSAASDPLAQILNTAIRKLYHRSGEQETWSQALLAVVSNMVKSGSKLLISSHELATRIQPLQQQWQAYGPGLIRQIANQTDGRLMVSNASVIAVQPIFGGGGAAHLDYNAVHWEALLTNANDRLPEVVRVAWLLAQLNNDLPVHSEHIHRDRLPMISGLAMLPYALTAAQELGICRYDRSLLVHALNHWMRGLLAQPETCDRERLANTIEDWWRVCASGSHAWNIALSALDQMTK